jgi:hypothetical protein
MWRLYLDLGKYSSNFLAPWYVWKIKIREDVRVFEVTTAAQWQDLVLRYPMVSERFIYPDWTKVAADFDAVHMTRTGIAAIQGICLQTPDGLLAPSFWDVETTLWLRWTFASVALEETVHSVPN